MYQNRHYPIWGKEFFWHGDPILDDNDDIKGFGALYPYVEDGHWHGQIIAAYFAINSLKLNHPDNTMSGTDVTLDMNQLTVEDLHRAVAEGFEPDYYQYYLDSVHNVAQLLGLDMQATSNYWLVGLATTSTYLDGETGEQCFQRIKEECPALDFFRDVIQTEEFAHGIQTGFKTHLQADEDIEEDDIAQIPFIDQTLPAHLKDELSQEILKLKDNVSTQFVRYAEKRCEYGLVHLCKRGDEVEPQQRGSVSQEEEYLPLVRKWQIEEYVESPQNEKIKLDAQALENYKTLIETYNGKDSYSLKPFITPNGEIYLDWHIGPNKKGEVTIGKNNSMSVHFVDNSDGHVNKQPREYSFVTGFDPNKLTEYMSEGIRNL